MCVRVKGYKVLTEFCIFRFMPWLSNLAPHLTGLNALKIAAQKMEAIFKNLIQERKKTFSIEKRHDFVDIYLHQILSEDNPKSSFYQEAGGELKFSLEGGLAVFQ